MSVNAANLVLGPARIYYAAFGTSEPADSAVTPTGYLTPPGGSWVDFGGTDGGVTVEIDTTYTPLQVDQIVMDVGARLTELKITVTAGLAEITQTNIQQALNSITSSGSGSGYITMDVQVPSSATQPTYSALIIDGWAPYTSGGNPALRRAIVRKVLSQAKVTLSGDKKTQQKVEATWQAYYVSSSINPLHLVDETT